MNTKNEQSESFSPKGKTLFIVEVVFETVVMAENAKDAEEFVRKNFSECELNNGSYYDFSARKFNGYPAGWDEHCFPYGDGSFCLGKILENDLEYQKKLSELKEMRERLMKNSDNLS